MNPVPTISPPFVTQVLIIKGCYYCYNKHIDKHRLHPPHHHQNKCPWFQHYLAISTCYLNNLGELCLGPRLVGC
jgi:hypothetical protein